MIFDPRLILLMHQPLSPNIPLLPFPRTEIGQYSSNSNLDNNKGIKIHFFKVLFIILLYYDNKIKPIIILFFKLYVWIEIVAHQIVGCLLFFRNGLFWENCGVYLYLRGLLLGRLLGLYVILLFRRGLLFRLVSHPFGGVLFDCLVLILFLWLFLGLPWRVSPCRPVLVPYARHR
jgi:hypothetical protein